MDFPRAGNAQGVATVIQRNEEVWFAEKASVNWGGTEAQSVQSSSHSWRFEELARALC